MTCIRTSLPVNQYQSSSFLKVGQPPGPASGLGTHTRNLSSTSIAFAWVSISNYSPLVCLYHYHRGSNSMKPTRTTVCHCPHAAHEQLNADCDSLRILKKERYQRKKNWNWLSRTAIWEGDVSCGVPRSLLWVVAVWVKKCSSFAAAVVDVHQPPHTCLLTLVS